MYGDKAYDNRNNFNILDKINAEPAIKIRKNASARSKGCPLRRDEVLLIRKLGYNGWKDLKDAGRRWIAEIVFSAIKRVFGEDSYQRSLVHKEYLERISYQRSLVHRKLRLVQRLCFTINTWNCKHKQNQIKFKHKSRQL